MNATHWKLRTKTITLDHPIFMGIVNVTPDSFSDGGRYVQPDDAVRHVLELIKQGAEIIDIGGETTKPGSDSVTADEELSRLMPVLQKLKVVFKEQNIEVPISVDTTKATVAYEVITKGNAEIINDISGLSAPKMLEVLSETAAAYCLMHTKGIPKIMQKNPTYEDVVKEVIEFLKQKRKEMIEAGIEPEKISIDPGIGFGKTTIHNLSIIENIQKFHTLNAPILVGHSRKNFIKETYQDIKKGTNTVTQQLIKNGVQIIRLHEAYNYFRF
ncbi:MAG: dihydropteroate synthase [Planctomycetaceae bacterium]|jgi:dihydropteroate synthase|nr:dihydropteroate synthase [Planctomycetaceae bacterium]